MPSARPLAERLRHLAPEALAFAAIGAANTLLYMAITWVALPIGAVKASILATVITTTLAYLANRYWTYRHHTRSALRREYTLFFGFNLAGMVIQSGAVAIGKYGFGLTEEHDEILFMGVTLVGIAIATVFRFWAYRTFVFLKPQQPAEEHTVAEMDPVAGLAELSTEEGELAVPQHRAAERHAGSPNLDHLGPRAVDPGDFDSEIAAEIDAAQRPASR
jgi:putative flippase GtrA